MDWQNNGFDWNRARTFLATVEEGSFSGAARVLGLAQPTVGRQVAALEQELGVALIERVGRGIRLTAAGADLAEHVRSMGEAASRLSLVAAGQSTSLEGLVRITASEVIAAYLLPPAIARIRAEHPGIELDIIASNAAQDLRRREADIAVRSFRPRDPELVAVKIQDGWGRLYAAPAYLERLGNPTDVAGLSGAHIFGFDRGEQMVRGLQAIGLPVDSSSFPVVTESHLVQWEMARLGLGICVMMDEVGDAEPGVRRVFDEPAVPVPMWVTSHRELRTSRRLRVVFDILVQELRGICEGRVS